MIKEQLKSDVLLPHQVDLLNKFQSKILFDWHFHHDFRQIKGTSFEGLNFRTSNSKKSLKSNNGIGIGTWRSGSNLKLPSKR